MADDLYLDGSQPYHRHPDIGDGDMIHPGSPVTCSGTALPVYAFDPDALTAHDTAVAQAALTGEGEPPVYVEGEWVWAIGEPSPIGEDQLTLVLAGEDQGGVVHVYATPERIARVCFDAITRVMG